jgi:hypothetical protein
MPPLRLSLVLALVAFSGCVAADSEEELLLRVELAGNSIETIEVMDTGATGEFADDLRPQVDGDTGVIWMDYSSGETLAEGWIVRHDDSADLTIAVPAPSAGEGLLTITIATEHGPFVATSYLEL